MGFTATASKTIPVARSFLQFLDNVITQNIRILSHMSWFLLTAGDLVQQVNDPEGHLARVLRPFESVSHSLNGLTDSSLRQRASLILQERDAFLATLPPSRFTPAMKAASRSTSVVESRFLFNGTLTGLSDKASEYAQKDVLLGI